MNPDSDGLHPVSNTEVTSATADIVFVHGLAGASHSTWRHGTPDTTEHFFWPEELGKELQSCRIWTVGYPAGISSFGRPGMAIEKRAGNIARKLTNSGIGKLPLFFVTHSMGGLIVKSLIVGSQTLPDEERKGLVAAVQGIVFCGTPHRGSSFATAASILGRFTGGVQIHVGQMQSNADQLDLLHDGFVEWHRHHPVHIESYAENIGLFRKRWLRRPLPLGCVVPRASANPGIAAHLIHDCDEDHLSLVKPASSLDDVFVGVLRFLQGALKPTVVDPVQTDSVRPPPDHSTDTAASPDDSAWKLLNRHLGPMLPERCISSSARTDVYVATDADHRRHIAKRTTRALVTRTARTIHDADGICDDQVYVTDGDDVFVARPYVDGISLSELLSRNRGGVQGALLTMWISQLVTIIARLQSERPGIIHRDVSPGNVIVSRETLALTLIDCKSAVAIDATSAPIIGTLPFAAPEQLDGRPDFSSDLYSVAMLSLFVAGKNPLPSPSVRKADSSAEKSLQLMMSRCTAHHPQNDWLHKMGALDARARYRDAHEVLSDTGREVTLPESFFGILWLGEGKAVLMRNLGFDLLTESEATAYVEDRRRPRNR